VLIVALVAAFLGYFAVRLLIRALPVLLIFAGILFVVFRWHLY